MCFCENVFIKCMCAILTILTIKRVCVCVLYFSRSGYTKPLAYELSLILGNSWSLSLQIFQVFGFA